MLPHEDILVRTRTYAVIPLVDAPQAEGSGKVVLTGTVTALYQCPGIRVVEQARLDDILKQRDLNISHLRSAETATEVGRLVGADAIIMGELTQYQAQETSGTIVVYVVAHSGTKYTHRVGLSIRAVRVADAKVIYARDGWGTSQEGFAEAAKQAAEMAIKPLRLFYQEKESLGKP
jgi:curli biogenesis system outer membrane secretion channel CsgG